MSGEYGSVEVGGDYIGSITGTVVGSRIAGVVDISGDGISGELDMLGAFFGDQGKLWLVVSPVQ